MDIYSKFLDASIELDGYVNNEQNLIIKHSSLYSYLNEKVDVHYDIIESSVEHGVVLCTMTHKIAGKEIVEIGETTRELLPDKFKCYPVTIAFEIAFDRAAIKMLHLPVNTYSSLEFLWNTRIDNVPGYMPDSQSKPIKQEHSHKQKDDPELPTDHMAPNLPLDGKKTSVEEYVIEIGVFKGMSVQEIFALAPQDRSVLANLKMLLTKDTKAIEDDKERYGIRALQLYYQRRKISL